MDKLNKHLEKMKSMVDDIKKSSEIHLHDARNNIDLLDDGEMKTFLNSALIHAKKGELDIAVFTEKIKELTNADRKPNSKHQV